MKITIELEGQIITIEDPEATTIDDCFQLTKQAFLGIGFHPDNVKEYFEFLNDEIAT